MRKVFCDLCQKEMDAPGPTTDGSTVVPLKTPALQGGTLNVRLVGRLMKGTTQGDICAGCVSDMATKALAPKPA